MFALEFARQTAYCARKWGVCTVLTHLKDTYDWYCHGMMPYDYYVVSFQEKCLQASDPHTWTDLDYVLGWLNVVGPKAYAHIMLTEGTLFWTRTGTFKSIMLFEDKFHFAQVLSAAGLSSSRVYGNVYLGVADFDSLPPRNIFAKCCDTGGGQGRGHFVLAYEGEKGGWQMDGKHMATALDVVDVLRLSGTSRWQLQDALTNHDALASLIAPATALCTFRLLTYCTADGKYVCDTGMIRMPQDVSAVVDNFHAGGLCVAVTFATGQLAQSGFASGVAGIRKLQNGKTFDGFRIPHFREILKCACSAHKAYNNYTGMRIVRFGVDVALTDEGPVFIEYNAFAYPGGQGIYGAEKPKGSMLTGLEPGGFSDLSASLRVH